MSMPGRAELAHRPEHLLALLGRPAYPRITPTTGCPRTGSGTKSSGRRGDARDPAAHLVGRVEHEVTPEPDDVDGHGRGVHQDAREDHGRHRVQPEVERGDDTEVAASAAEAPEQLRVLGSRRGDRAAVGGDDLGREQVVAGEAELALEPAAATAEREPADARCSARGRP